MRLLRAISTGSLALLAAGLAACAEEPEEARYADSIDPIVEQALSDRLLSDPDLVGQNEANAALIGGANASLPLEVVTPEAIRKAADRARELVAAAGGRTELPEPTTLEDIGEDSPLELLADQIGRLEASAECIEDARHSAEWAGKLPAELPIYPRGGTVDAMGSDRGACMLRAVRFVTPVEAKEVAAFYYSMAASAGFSPRYSVSETHHRIEGERANARFSVHLRPGLEGLIEVDLVVDGT